MKRTFFYFFVTVATDPNANGMCFMLKVTYESPDYAARFLSPVMIFPCIGSRDEESNRRLRDAMKLETWGSVQSLRRESHESSDTCCMVTTSASLQWLQRHR